MELFLQFINEYGTTILYALLTAIAGYLGIIVKDLLTKWINTKTKREIAKTVVEFVEQVYKDIHGEEKLNEAMRTFSAMLAEKGITITDLEMKFLLEAAVFEFNSKIKSKEEKQPEFETDITRPEVSE